MADINLEAVAGKLNRVGYEALFKGLRQAKGDEACEEHEHDSEADLVVTHAHSPSVFGDSPRRAGQVHLNLERRWVVARARR